MSNAVVWPQATATDEGAPTTRSYIASLNDERQHTVACDGRQKVVTLIQDVLSSGVENLCEVGKEIGCQSDLVIGLSVLTWTYQRPWSTRCSRRSMK